MYTGILWEGNQGGAASVLRYWQNNKNAFYTADDMSKFITSISGTTATVAAHSMGNVVMGSAISDFKLKVKDYFMIDPAVALEAYDASQLNVAEMMHPDWSKYYYPGDEIVIEGKTVPFSGVSGRKLWTTQWHTLFEDGDEDKENDDQRSKLKWKNRFKEIFKKGINIVQYYSEGEEVLQTATAGQAPSGLELDGPAWDGGRNSWNVSEKAKGDRGVSGSLFIGESHAGWEFRELTASEIFSDYKVACATDKLLAPLLDIRWRCRADVISAVDAKAIHTETLKTNPFFKHFEDENLLSPDKATGSNSAKLQHPHLLSYDIPSLSFAAGGTMIDDKDEDLIKKDNKVDMNSATKIKTNGWPQERENNDWYHSDFKDVAYLYTSKLFKNMVSKGDLK